MSNLTGMLIGYAGVLAGWTYENVFLVVVSMIVLAVEGATFIKEKESNE